MHSLMRGYETHKIALSPLEQNSSIIYEPSFLSYFKYWPDDGLLRLKLVAK